jgi:protocatechuate 3,4-dioxygenase beta subunit
VTVALMAVVVVAAQTQVRPATIEGTVKNLKTGEPIADVRVSLTSELAAAGAKSATSDAEGKFSITGVTPGRYNVAAARTLFFRPRRNAGPSALTVAEGERLAGIQFYLSPTAVISGRVFDERRDAQRSVRLEALRREYRDGVPTFVSAGQATTDDRGEYRLFNLTPGTYYVRATQQNMTPLYYPGLHDPDNAVAVEVEAGGEAAAIDIELRRIPEHAVRLKLGGLAPGSIVNFFVKRKSSRSNDQLNVRAEMLPDNTYKLSLPSGSYEVVVIQVRTNDPTGARGASNAGMIPVLVGNVDQDLGTVAFPPTVTLNGRLVAAEPVPSLDLARVNVSLVSLDAVSLSSGTRGSNPSIDGNGNFSIANLGTGRYRIQLIGLPADAFLISAREGPREVLESNFTVRGDPELLELRIGGRGSIGSVDGTVVNALGQPVSAATVVLIPGPERRTNATAFKTSTSDQNGNFSIRSILPGDYKVLAWEDVETGAYFDPEFLKNFETRGEAVRIQRGSQNRVTLRVIPAS